MSACIDIFFPADENQPVRGIYYATADSPEACGDASTIQLRAAGLRAEAIRVFIPGEWVCLYHAVVPRAGRKQAEKLLPALLEEEVGENIEALHFALLALAGEQATVAVIQQQKMQQITAWLAATGIVTRTVLPDWMAQACGTLLIENDRCRLRSAPWAGWSCSLPLAPALLTAQLQQLSAPLLAHCAGEQPASLAPLLSNKEAIRLSQQSALPRAEVFSGSLLSGGWRPKVDYRLQWRRWRKVILSFAACLLLLTLERGLALWSINAQVAQRRQGVEQQFLQRFPEQKRIVNLRAQMEAALRSSGQRSEGELTVLLPRVAQVFASLPPDPQEELISLRFNQPQQTLFLQFHLPDFRHFTALREAFAATFNIQQEQAQKEEDHIRAELTLSRKRNDAF